MRRVLLAGIAALSLSACGTVRTEGGPMPGLQSPRSSNGYQGVLYVELGGLSDAIPFMARSCQTYGGVNEASIINKAPDGLVAINALVGNFYFYRCNGPSVIQSQSVQSNQVQPVSSQGNITAGTSPSIDLIESAKEKCADLGFKPQTEKFGDCVLRLGK